MTTSKVNLQLELNESARKVTLEKRKNELVKEMEEITTSTGIKGCMVIYDPKQNEKYIWPSEKKAMEMIAEYESTKMNQAMKNVDYEKFMELKVNKLRDQIEKMEKKNMEMRASLILYQLTQGKTMKDLNIDEVELLYRFSKIKISEINDQIFSSTFN